MTKNYISGFFTKCAEHKLPYDTAVGLYKLAIDDDFRRAQQDMAMNFARNNKFLGDVSKHLEGEDGFGDNRMGNLVGRTFGSIFNGSRTRERHERANYIDALRRAGKKEYEAQLAALNTPEERMRLKEQFDQYNAQLDAGLEANEHGNGLTNEERDLAAYGGDGVKRVPQPQGPGARPIDRYQQLLNGEINLPAFYRHAFDGSTGEFYRTDGRTLDPEAVLWNERMRRSRQAVADYDKAQKTAPKPKVAPKDAPYQPADPTARREFSVW